MMNWNVNGFSFSFAVYLTSSYIKKPVSRVFVHLAYNTTLSIPIIVSLYQR